MAQATHIARDGVRRLKCEAPPGECKLGTQHFEGTLKEQQAQYEAYLEQQNGPATGGVRRSAEMGGGLSYGETEAAPAAAATSTQDPPSLEALDNTKEDPQQEREVRYSFKDRFQALEEEHNKEYEGFPKRFFGVNLLEKQLSYSAEIAESSSFEDMSREAQERSIRDPRALAERLAATASAPADLRATEAQAKERLAALGYDISTWREVDDNTTLRSFKTEKAWMVENEEGETLLVTSASQGSKSFGKYRLRRPSATSRKDYMLLVDQRALAGAERVQRRSGVSVMRVTQGKPSSAVDEAALEAKIDNYVAENAANAYVRHGTEENRVFARRSILRDQVRSDTVDAVLAMREAQLEGSNFIAQKRHIKEANGAVASAWQDKKHYKKSHQEAMKTTPLNKVFSKVDIDDDVDLEEFKDFEKSVLEIQDKLPPMDPAKAPRLGVRKLGKHRADGLFAPQANALMVDVNTSGSFMHEYGHYIDLVASNNSSLQKDFHGIAREYATHLKIPENHSGRGAEYYTTATEQFARLTEMYAVERLGIKNRLVNPDNFKEFDYAPFRERPELKERGFQFLDKVFDGLRKRG